MFSFNKKSGKDFTVLNLTDPQLTVSEWNLNGKNKHILTYTVDELIKSTAPDLITVSGDISFASQTQAYENFAALLNTYKLPWAFVWGNHDNQEGAQTVDKLADIMLSHKYCVFEKGDPALGCGNYAISINENGKTVYALIMMDSHDRMNYTDPDGNTTLKWAHLLPEQLEWYCGQLEQLGNIKTALIMHIPLYTYREAFAAAWNSGYDTKSVTPAESYDPKYWNDGYKDSYGAKYEGVGSYPADTGEFDCIKKLGSTEIVLVGHEHINNYVINYQGVTLAYSLKTGPGCYWNEALNGGTVLRISKDGGKLEHIYVDVRSITE